jgi:hypothetical protein
MAPTEPTRYSNPPCTLKESGYNRWEWLCFNPQDKAILPFERNVAYRTVVKDNHVPCIPHVADATNSIPNRTNATVDLVSTWRMPKGLVPQEAALAVNSSIQSCQNMREAFLAK